MNVRPWFAAGLLTVLVAAAIADEAPLPIHAPDYKPDTFQPRQTLENYYGLPTPDGGIVTAEMIRKLSAQERTSLLAFAHFPEKSRVSSFGNVWKRRQADLEQIAKREAEGKSLALFIGLPLAGGELVTADMLDELPLSARSFLLAFAHFDDANRAKVVGDRLKFLNEEKAKEADMQKKAEQYDLDQATKIAERVRRDAENKAQDAVREAEREVERLKREAAAAKRDAEAKAAKEKREAEQKEATAQRDAEREANRLLQDAERAQREEEQKALAALEKEEELANPRPRPAPPPSPVHTPPPSPPAAPMGVARVDEPPPAPRTVASRDERFNHPAFRTKVDRSGPMSMEQFKREMNMRSNENANGSFRISGRAVRGLVGLGLFLFFGLIAGVRMLFRGRSE